MFFLSSQGWLGNLWFTRVSVAHGRRSAPKSVITFIVIVLLHVGIIVIALQVKSAERDTASTPSFKMIYLAQEKPPVQTELNSPVIERISIKVPMVLPEINVDEESTLIVDKPSADYELANPNSAKYRDVFDPKMRQKLIDAQGINRPLAKEKSGSWIESDGRVFIDMGDGNCMVSMQKMDSRERGTNWGGTRCGKNNSEKMMDSVMADFESRKHPLKTQ